MHKLNTLHLDLKPTNYFVAYDHDAFVETSGQYSVRIGDMGASAVPSAVSLTTSLRGPNSSGAWHTLAYASPEQIHGGDLDGRADLYATGVILWEAATGSLPFPTVPGVPSDSVYRRHDEQMRAPLARPEGMSVELFEALGKALRYARDERHASAREFMVALEGCLAEMERRVEAEREERRERLRYVLRMREQWITEARQNISDCESRIRMAERSKTKATATIKHCQRFDRVDEAMIGALDDEMLLEWVEVAQTLPKAPKPTAVPQPEPERRPPSPWERIVEWWDGAELLLRFGAGASLLLGGAAIVWIVMAVLSPRQGPSSPPTAEVPSVQCERGNGAACAQASAELHRAARTTSDLQRSNSLKQRACALGHRESCPQAPETHEQTVARVNRECAASNTNSCVAAGNMATTATEMLRNYQRACDLEPTTCYKFAESYDFGRLPRTPEIRQLALDRAQRACAGGFSVGCQYRDRFLREDLTRDVGSQ